LILRVSREEIEAKLPPPLHPWAYANEPDPFWHGRTGHFQTADEIEQFVQFIERHRAEA
jgi:hypothetical protein